MPKGEPVRVLVVEDSEVFAESLTGDLRRHGYDVVSVSTGARALEAFTSVQLVLLALELSDMDGLEVCRRIRTAGDTPVIALTSQGDELNRVLGLQAGADDCLRKPYGVRELMARIEAVMRRVRPRADPGSQEVISYGSLTINPSLREIRLDGEPIEVTRKEFDLLHYLASNPGAVITRQRLMAELWGNPVAHSMGPKASRTVDTHISTLRSKLGSSSWILTVRGVGFRFASGECAVR